MKDCNLPSLDYFSLMILDISYGHFFLTSQLDCELLEDQVSLSFISKHLIHAVYISVFYIADVLSMFRIKEFKGVNFFWHKGLSSGLKSEQEYFWA